ncbi:MAG: ATPase [Desulfobacteraceae bacterium]|nr:ATPase [Desulfobacteraceae bacterium]MCF8093980.1 ATPase [Desulfobacteraceae bacterium]
MSVKTRFFISPFALPIIFFGVVILVGTLLLYLPASTAGGFISWQDALFTATSATCVTGLVVVDTGSYFTVFGQSVILAMIQAGGLGIITITSLFFYLWRRQVPLKDRIAVGQSLLSDPSFQLGRFLTLIAVYTILIEAAGAVMIHVSAAGDFSLYASVFHAVSAFCNAGFSLFSGNLEPWRGDLAINLAFIILIILGGLGFAVLVEIFEFFSGRMPFVKSKNPRGFSWYAGVVLKSTLFFLLVGWIGIYIGEFAGIDSKIPALESMLAALFQSVTSRTAGFNTINIGDLTNVTLLIMIVLMYIGGAPGSCAGGIKVTTFRTLTAYAWSHIKGRDQAVVGRFAVNEDTLNRAFLLLVFSIGVVFAALLILNFTEGGAAPHSKARGLFLEILFETVSAFGTVGLSTGLTPHLSLPGKLIITGLMFVGRLGPILFLAVIRSYQQPVFYRRPEESMLIG